jgi:predicted TIM-barrel fold metal-dependent hydrolase
MLIDMHVHMFSDKIAERALTNLARTCKTQYYTDGTVDGTGRKLREWGVDLCAALNIATKPKQQTTINNWAASIQSPSILCFGSVHPDAPDAIEELERIKSLGLYGVKLHPDYQNFLADDKKMYSIYEAISELGLPVTFHTGRDPLSPDLVHASPSAIAKIAEDFPRMKIIAAHLGGMMMSSEVEELLAGKNIYFDTAMCSMLCPLEQFERIVDKHGADRILFASDCPWSRSCDGVKYIERTKISSQNKDLIYYKNAVDLLNLNL